AVRPAHLDSAMTFRLLPVDPRRPLAEMPDRMAAGQSGIVVHEDAGDPCAEARTAACEHEDDQLVIAQGRAVAVAGGVQTAQNLALPGRHWPQPGRRLRR